MKIIDNQHRTAKLFVTGRPDGQPILGELAKPHRKRTSKKPVTLNMKELDNQHQCAQLHSIPVNRKFKQYEPLLPYGKISWRWHTLHLYELITRDSHSRRKATLRLCVRHPAQTQ